jgi:hypothetical protein
MTHLESLYYTTGCQDCCNVFDGDDVPTADDLREGWEYGHASDEIWNDQAQALACRDAWVRGWLECATAQVKRERERDAKRRAEEAEYD